MKKQIFPFYVLLAIVATAVVFNSCNRDEPEIDNPKTTDAGVVINGVRWATRNVDMPGTFADRPEDAGMFYQWGRNIGWSSTDPMINSNGDTEWDNGWHRGDTWTGTNDPCPRGWRLPTMTEVQILLNVNSEIYIKNGVPGRMFRSGITGNSVFLPMAGQRRSFHGAFFHSDGALLDVGTWGGYWSSSALGSQRAYAFLFNSSFMYGFDADRANGLSVRCVSDD